MAELIVSKYCPEMSVVKLMFTRTRVLEKNQVSDGLYAIVSTKKDIVLRIHIRQELANMYIDNESRHLEEVFIQVLK